MALSANAGNSRIIKLYRLYVYTFYLGLAVFIGFWLVLFGMILTPVTIVHGSLSSGFYSKVTESWAAAHFGIVRIFAITASSSYAILLSAGIITRYRLLVRLTGKSLNDMSRSEMKEVMTKVPEMIHTPDEAK